MTHLLDHIASQFMQSIETKTRAMETLAQPLQQAAEAGIKTIQEGGTIFWIGNGGSAADAQHMAAELVGRYKKERKAIRSQALTANSSSLTAIGNDYGYERVFDRQLEAFGSAKDTLIAISTSGNSENVIRALQLARKLGMFSIGLTGETGGKMAQWVDILLNVPSQDTARIQETHLLIGHILCDLIEQSVL
jgi:D-sedoheptulose 7-phosphate isomerase